MKEEMISKSSIADRIEDLKKERENYLAQANSQIAAINGAISVLENLLNPEPEEDLPKEK